MADFERTIVNGDPCRSTAIVMEVHGLALKSPDRPDIVHAVSEYAASAAIRQIVDVAQLAQFMEYEVETQGAKGPLIGMWATQLCANHGEGNNLVRKKVVLERLGSWFLPADSSYMNERFSVTREEPYKSPSWQANAHRTNEKGRIRAFNPSLFGITLPRTPQEITEETAYEAVLLARAGGRDIFGFLHHPVGKRQGSIERIIAPPAVGQVRRPNDGAMLSPA